MLRRDFVKRVVQALAGTAGLATVAELANPKGAAACYTGWNTYQKDACRYERQAIHCDQPTGVYQCMRTCYPRVNWRDGRC